MAVIYGGFVPQPGRWHSGVKLGGVNTPPIEFLVDTRLPDLGQDQHYPNRDFIVIPRGRIVGPRPTDLTRQAGETVLTIATGVDPLNKPSFITEGVYPFGYAPFHIYRDFAGLPAERPLGVLHETIEVPYTVVNEAYNTNFNGGSRLKVGEWLMPYYGSANKQSGVPQDKGKLVRFVARKVWQTSVSTASAQVELTNAPFPAFLPRVLIAFDGANVPVTSGATLTYSEQFAKWVASFGNAVKTVIYEYGADDCQRIAQCIGIEPVGTAGGINASNYEMSGWLKWVTDNFGAWDWPPILHVRPSTSVTNEVLSVDSNNEATVANKPVVPFKSITITVTGTLTKIDGTTQSLNGEVLALVDDHFFNDYTQGALYDLDMLTGKVRFASNLSITAATISYSYETDFRDGIKYDRGMFNLTDGRDSGLVGLPPHLDVAGVRGAIRAMILP